MNRPSNKYWQNRFILLTESLLKTGERHSRDLVKEYEKAMIDIERDIELFYQRFSENNEISIVEAKRLLNSRELQEFKWTVEEYIHKAKRSQLDNRWIKQLENVSIRMRVSRLEALHFQLRQQVELITAKRLVGLTKLSEELIKEGYYRSIYEIQKGFGVGTSFAKLDTRTIESIISKPWAPDGSNFSDRIWRDRELLMNELQKELAQSFIRGDAPDIAIRNIAKTMNTSKKAAGRLVMTESAFFANEARFRAFKELGVEEFQFLATLDMRTSEICQDMDLKIFRLADMEIGINWPPLHPWCRSTCIPYFEGNIVERIARDPETGKGYYVRGNMDYKEWYKEHIEGKHGKDEAETMRKKQQNKGVDLEQYNRYKKTLGDDLGVKSFEEFQNMKYNDSERWNKLKSNYSHTNRFNKIIEESSNLNIKGQVIKDINRIDINDFKFADFHINSERNHNITKEMAQSYINNAEVAYSRWKGEVVVYVSKEGCSVVNLKDKIVSTAYSSSEYDDKFKKIMELIKND